MIKKTEEQNNTLHIVDYEKEYQKVVCPHYLEASKDLYTYYKAWINMIMSSCTRSC